MSHSPETSTKDLRFALRAEFPEIAMAGTPRRRLYEVTQPVSEEMFGSDSLEYTANMLTHFLSRYRERFGIGRGVAVNQLRSVPLLRMTAMLLPDAAGEDQMIVACNPELTDPVGSARYNESCITDSGYACPIIEPWGNTFNWRDVQGNQRSQYVEGSAARLVQHEVRHLDGVTAKMAAGEDNIRTLTGGIQEIRALPPIERLS
jgi:peptide deformylase